MRLLYRPAAIFALCLGAQGLVSLPANAIVMNVDYEGLINTFGNSSSPYFRNRPTTTIAGSLSYDTDTPAIPGTIDTGFALLDYGFTISFPDREDYVGTGITDFGNGNISVPEISDSGRVDMLVQGVFIGPDFGFDSPTGSRLQLVDGNTVTAANVLVADTLPSSAFTLDDITGGSMFLEWTDPTLGGRSLAYFNLTSLSVAPASTIPVPEPGALSIMGVGLIGLFLVRRRKAMASGHQPD